MSGVQYVLLNYHLLGWVGVGAGINPYRVQGNSPPLLLPVSASATLPVNNISQTVLQFSNFFCLLRI